MSDAVLVSLIVSITSLIGTLCTLAVTVYIRRDVGKIEIATNSMKDALVLSASKEGRLAGHAEGVKSERNAIIAREGEEATIAAGVAEMTQRNAEHDAWQREQKAKP